MIKNVFVKYDLFNCFVRISGFTYSSFSNVSLFSTMLYDNIKYMRVTYKYDNIVWELLKSDWCELSTKLQVSTGNGV